MRFLLTLSLFLSTTIFAEGSLPTVKTFSVMSYNAENLFDTLHDEGKNDYPNLPIELKKGKYKKETEESCLFNGPIGSPGFSRCFNLNWNQQTLDRKLSNLTKAISMFDNGKGADAVILQEVENQNVMNLLLKKARILGYQFALLLEDEDSRGIDVAIISKYPIISSKLYQGSPDSGVKRGIYQFNLNVDSFRIVILGNHWPSRHNDVQDRMNASDLFMKTAEKIPRADLVIGMGDFNTIDKEVPNAIHAVYNDFFDAKPEAQKLGIKLFPGTYKYRGVWDVLDRILIRKSDLAQGRVKPLYQTFEIVYNELLLGKENLPQNTPSGNFQGGRTIASGSSRNSRNSSGGRDDLTKEAPLRFNPANGQGFSDHLPVAMKFQLGK